MIGTKAFKQRHGQSLFLELGEEARNVIYKLSNLSSPDPKPKCILSNGTSHAINLHPMEDDVFVFTHKSLPEPPNIYLFDSSASGKPITDHNSNWLAKVRLSHGVETFTFAGAQDDPVSAWHVELVNGRKDKSPLAFLIHVRPQSSWYDAGSVTSYEHPETFEKYNPVNYVAKWSQPMLIIHGGRDYRVF